MNEYRLGQGISSRSDRLRPQGVILAMNDKAAKDLRKGRRLQPDRVGTCWIATPSLLV